MRDACSREAAFPCMHLQLPYLTRPAAPRASEGASLSFSSGTPRAVAGRILTMSHGNVMISTMHLEGKEEKFSLSLWFKQQAGQEWQRASIVTPLAIYEGTTCKSLYIPFVEGNWCFTAVNIRRLIAPFSIFSVTGWREEPLQITSKGKLRSAGLGSLIFSRF